MVQGPHFGNLQTAKRTKRRGMQVVGIASAKDPVASVFDSFQSQNKGTEAGVKKRGTSQEMHWRRI